MGQKARRKRQSQTNILYKCPKTESYHPNDQKTRKPELNDTLEEIKQETQLEKQEICPLYTPDDLWQLAGLLNVLRPDIWTFKNQEHDPTKVRWGEENLTYLTEQIAEVFEKEMNGQ